MADLDFSSVMFEVIDTDIPDFPDRRELHVEVRIDENSLAIAGDYHPGFGELQRFEFAFAKENIIEISATINADPPRDTEPNWMHTYTQSTVDIWLKDKYEVVDKLSISLGSHSSYWTRALLKEIESKLGISAEVADNLKS